MNTSATARLAASWRRLADRCMVWLDLRKAGRRAEGAVKGGGGEQFENGSMDDRPNRVVMVEPFSVSNSEIVRLLDSKREYTIERSCDQNGDWVTVAKEPSGHMVVAYESARAVSGLLGTV